MFLLCFYYTLHSSFVKLQLHYINFLVSGLLKYLCNIVLLGCFVGIIERVLGICVLGLPCLWVLVLGFRGYPLSLGFAFLYGVFEIGTLIAVIKMILALCFCFRL